MFFQEWFNVQELWCMKKSVLCSIVRRMIHCLSHRRMVHSPSLRMMSHFKNLRSIDHCQSLRRIVIQDLSKILSKFKCVFKCRGVGNYHSLPFKGVRKSTWKNQNHKLYLSLEEGRTINDLCDKRVYFHCVCLSAIPHGKCKYFNKTTLQSTCYISPHIL